MLNFLIIVGKCTAFISRQFNFGNGSTWPGHVALSINKNFIRDILRKNYSSNDVRSSRFARIVGGLKIILIAGTNGKTTTGKLIQTVLTHSGKKVFQNEAGANLLNGIASSIVLHSSVLCEVNYDFAIFEVDENTLPLALKEIEPDYLILLNLFRDQLDRYGEVNTIANKWQKALEKLTPKTSLILNSDDPQISYLGFGLSSRRNKVTERSHGIPHFVRNDRMSYSRQARKVLYFGLNDQKFAQKNPQHASDSTYCPNCGSKLSYSKVYYSHLGDWECNNCHNRRPRIIFSNPSSSSLVGIYNKYNVLAAVLLAKQVDIEQKTIDFALRKFSPAFGRQEMLNVDGKKIQIFLSKNPTGFNESLRTVKSLGGKNILLVLNDRIPDGRDVSWIWDVDFEDYVDDFKNIIISGDRCYDMGLRVKYASEFSIFNFQFSMKNSNFKFQIEEDLKNAISLSLDYLPKSETLYILPTYSAMLEVRKILTGKKIL